jgi:hypothetical protein
MGSGGQIKVGGCRPASGNRAGGAPGSATTTPSRPSAQQSVMNLLGSPMFERMVGCATPPSAGRTQPSAATLAALQSPQPSRVPEPFWTPFTGLFQVGCCTVSCRTASAPRCCPFKPNVCGLRVVDHGCADGV